jgi:hypothetical protein
LKGVFSIITSYLYIIHLFPIEKNVKIHRKSEKSHEYAQKPQRNCTLMNSIFGGDEEKRTAVGRTLDIIQHLFFLFPRGCLKFLYLMYILVMSGF